MLWPASVLLVTVHLFLADEAYPLPARLLASVPGVLFLWEVRRFARESSALLPFELLALLQFYVAFSVPTFFTPHFEDLSGPFVFTNEILLSGTIAVALGALSLAAGAALGRRSGDRLRRFMLRFAPPASFPSRGRPIVIAFALLATTTTFIFDYFRHLAIAELAMPIFVIAHVNLAMGIAFTTAPARGSRGLPLFIFIAEAAMGLMRARIEWVFRGGLSYFAGAWARSRQVSFRLLAFVGVLYVITQPIKAQFRAEVWGEDPSAVGISARLEVWSRAFSSFWLAEESVADEAFSSSMSRLSEFAAVMHGLALVPERVPFANGAGWLPVLYSPIPRFLWPEKPSSRDHIQTYGARFNRQTESGAETTSILLPLLVDGYWNFGWPGIAVACLLIGGFAGSCARIFRDHWALSAAGILFFSTLDAHGSIFSVLGSVVQTFAGAMIGCWLVWIGARLISPRRVRRGIS